MTSRLFPEGEVRPLPVGSGGGLRGDAAQFIDQGLLDVSVKMNVGSPVTLFTTTNVPTTPFTMELDYAFLTDTGTLSACLNDHLQFSLLGDPSKTNLLQDFSFLVDDPNLLGLANAKLAFTFDGLHGSQFLLRNITFPGLGNANFNQLDNGWFMKGPGTLELVATVSEGNLPLVLANSTVPEPSTLSLLALGLAGLLFTHRVRRQAV